MAIRMRRGNEADFDPSKMLPGEWAVSTDTKYVRMCFSPGIVLRMATYEAFESDMAEIRKILSQCQNIQTAVELIQKNVTNSELVIENYVKEAKQYRDEAEQFRNEAFSTTPEGYEDLVKNVSDNTVKIDTIIEKAELNIKNNAKGSNIHLTDSAESNVVALELYGKTEQNAYTGKNLFSMRKSNTASNGISVTVDNENQSFSASGTATSSTSISIIDNYDEIKEKLKNGGTFTMSLVNATFDSAKCNISIAYGYNETTYWIKANGEPITVPSGSSLYSVGLYIPSGTIVNLTDVKIQLEEGNVATEWEPYVGGMPSPSPSYPQEIKSVKGKNELDCRGLTEQEVNGGKFTPVYDDNGNLLYVNVNGTFSAFTEYEVVLQTNPVTFAAGDYIINGCPNGGSESSYYIVVGSVTDGVTSRVSVDYGNSGTFELSENTSIYLIIRVYSGTVCNNLKFYPMIRSASIKDDTYVPYGLLRIKTRTKNILKRFTDTTLNGVDFSVDEKGIVTMNGISTAGIWYGVTLDSSYYTDGDILYVSGCDYSEDKGYCQIEMTSNGTTNYSAFKNGEEIKIKVLPNTTKIRYVIYIKTGITLSNIKVYPMISVEGGEYEPYQSSEITLSEPIELNGFNGVYDVVTSEGVTRRFAKVVYDGSSDENWIKHTTRENVYFITKSDKKANKKCLCTHYIDLQGPTFDTYDYSMWNGVDFMIRDKDCSTLAEWKAKLQFSPITIVYELATPTTEEMQSDLTALKTFYHETYVSNDADCDMSITYTADAKNYIDNKIALLTTALYNNI